MSALHSLPYAIPCGHGGKSGISFQQSCRRHSYKYGVNVQYGGGIALHEGNADTGFHSGTGLLSV